MSVHIYAPPVIDWKTKPVHCTTCEKKTPFLIQSWEWHPSLLTCLECGERYGEERLPRPFERGWREKSIQEAQRFIGQMKV